MSRRPTFSQLRWPDDPSGQELPAQWATSVSFRILGLTWRAFDRLQAYHLSQVDLSQPLEQLERDLTRNHFVEIQFLFSNETDGFASFAPVPEWPEMESRSPAPARPPTYDFAFVATANRRWAWPLEAKVVTSPNALSEYLKDVRDKFIEGIAAPLTGEGAMIAYLLTPDVPEVFRNLNAQLNPTLKRAPGFQDRPHRISHHSRESAPDLDLHHLLMQCVEEPAE